MTNSIYNKLIDYLTESQVLALLESILIRRMDVRIVKQTNTVLLESLSVLNVLLKKE